MFYCTMSCTVYCVRSDLILQRRRRQAMNRQSVMTAGVPRCENSKVTSHRRDVAVGTAFGEREADPLWSTPSKLDADNDAGCCVAPGGGRRMLWPRARAPDCAPLEAPLRLASCSSFLSKHTASKTSVASCGDTPPPTGNCSSNRCPRS